MSAYQAIVLLKSKPAQNEFCNRFEADADMTNISADFRRLPRTATPRPCEAANFDGLTTSGMEWVDLARRWKGPGTTDSALPLDCLAKPNEPLTAIGVYRCGNEGYCVVFY
jgi:hypothetical protein